MVKSYCLKSYRIRDPITGVVIGLKRQNMKKVFFSYYKIRKYFTIYTIFEPPGRY